MNWDLLTVSLWGFCIIFQSDYAIQNVKFLKLKEVGMMAQNSLQDTLHFRLCTSCSPHSYETICHVVVSLSVSLEVKPKENREGKKKINCSFRVNCYHRSCRYLTEAISWCITGIPEMGFCALWQTCTLDRITEDLFLPWDYTVIAMWFLEVSCKTLLQRKLLCSKWKIALR